MECTVPKISTLLDQVDNGTLLLPEFQRGFVWNRTQIRGLMRSLSLGYPIGGLLIWEATPKSRYADGNGRGLLLLDGQQRITTLYSLIRGRPPRFFDGDPSVFDGLSCDLHDMTFHFRSGEVSRNSLSIDVRRLFAEGIGAFLDDIRSFEVRAPDLINRLNRLVQIKERDLPEERITGLEQRIDTVVDIFNQVNSGGRRLSRADIALAKLCAESRNARQLLRDQLDRWSKAGYHFNLEQLLRMVTAVATGRGFLTALETLTASEFEAALSCAPKYVDTFLDALGRLGLDYGRILIGRAQMPVICRVLHLSGGVFSNNIHRDRTVYWYINAALHHRNRSSSESTVNRDLAVVDKEGVDGLISGLRTAGGRGMDISHAFDVAGSCSGSMLYFVSGVRRARDLCVAEPFSIGDRTSPRRVRHTIFPRRRLREIGMPPSYVNTIANSCFVSKDTANRLRGRDPAEYLAEIEAGSSGVLESQWIPREPRLWRTTNYPEFIEARTELLVRAIQECIEELNSVQPAPEDAYITEAAD